MITNQLPGYTTKGNPVYCAAQIRVPMLRTLGDERRVYEGVARSRSEELPGRQPKMWMI